MRLFFDLGGKSQSKMHAVCGLIRRKDGKAAVASSRKREETVQMDYLLLA